MLGQGCFLTSVTGKKLAPKQCNEKESLCPEKESKETKLKGPKEKWLHLVTTEEGRQGRFEEELAGMSTNGAKENSKILKQSLVDANHKHFDHKDPKMRKTVRLKAQRKSNK